MLCVANIVTWKAAVRRNRDRRFQIKTSAEDFQDVLAALKFFFSSATMTARNVITISKKKKNQDEIFIYSFSHQDVGLEEEQQMLHQKFTRADVSGVSSKS